MGHEEIRQALAVYHLRNRVKRIKADLQRAEQAATPAILARAEAIASRQSAARRS